MGHPALRCQKFTGDPKKHPYTFTEEKKPHEALLNGKTPTLPQAAPSSHEFLGDRSCLEDALALSLEKGLAGNAWEWLRTGEVPGAAPTPPSEQREERLGLAFAMLGGCCRF